MRSQIDAGPETNDEMWNLGLRNDGTILKHSLHVSKLLVLAMQIRSKVEEL